VSFYTHGFYQKQKAAGDPPAWGITCDFLASQLILKISMKAFYNVIFNPVAGSPFRKKQKKKPRKDDFRLTITFSLLYLANTNTNLTIQ